MTLFSESLKKTVAGIGIALLVLLSIQAVPVARAVDAVFNVTLTVDAEIAINGTAVGTTTLANIALLPNISLSNDVASNSQNDIQIETTDPDGYTLTLHATSSPAMQHDTTGTDINNYNGATAEQWDTASGNTEFGFGVFSSTSGGADTDIVDAFEDPDSDTTTADACLGLGVNNAPTFANFTTAGEEPVGFAAAPIEASAITIASRAAATSGPTDIDLCFYVHANNDSPDAGSYTATIVLRATVN